MHRSTKIATCCYCGTRAALVLDRARHELACGACGAPLHNLKNLPCDSVGLRKPAPTVVTHQSPKKLKSKKPRKSFAKSFLSEAFDLIGDILD